MTNSDSDPSTRRDDSVVAGLIAALASGGEFVDEGAFVLDHAGADKLARYRLADPSVWPVFLVEVAVLLAATQIRFRFSGWVIEVVIVDRGVDPSLVETVDGSPNPGPDVARSNPGGRRALDPTKLLGVGIRAARHRGIDTLVLEAVDEQGHGRRRTWVAGESDVVEDARVETCACVGAPGLRLWLRFASTVAEPGERERAWLLRRCRASRFPVVLDDKQISVGWIGAFGSFGANRVNAGVPLVRDGVEVGLAGLHEHTTSGGRVLLMQNQVVVEEIGFATATRAFTAAIEIDADRDLSLTRFVRGPELAAALEVVQHAYPKVRAEAIETARRLQTALALPELEYIDAKVHDADQLALREATRSPAKLAGGVLSVAAALGLWLSYGLGVVVLIPVLMLGVGLFLLLRETG